MKDRTNRLATSLAVVLLVAGSSYFLLADGRSEVAAVENPQRPPRPPRPRIPAIPVARLRIPAIRAARRRLKIPATRAPGKRKIRVRDRVRSIRMQPIIGAGRN
jgi:hypothetical protein